MIFIKPITIVLMIGMLVRCSSSKSPTKLEKLEFSIETSSIGNNYFWNNENEVIKILDNCDEFYNYFDNEKYEINETFIEEINKLEERDFFINKSIIYYLKIGSGDSKLIDVFLDNNEYELNITFNWKVGYQEDLYIHLNFIEIDKEFTNNNNNKVISFSYSRIDC